MVIYIFTHLYKTVYKCIHIDWRRKRPCKLGEAPGVRRPEKILEGGGRGRGGAGGHGSRGGARLEMS